LPILFLILIIQNNTNITIIPIRNIVLTMTEFIMNFGIK
jgi:hypothetical protein